MHTPFRTSWGVSARLIYEFDQFAKTPVDMVDGVIVTPITKLYRLLMDAEAKERCPEFADRFLNVGNGSVLLDLDEEELLERCCGPSHRLR